MCARRVASTAYDNERPAAAAFRSRYVACNIFNVAHRVISPTQNGAQKCTKVVRDAPLRGARSFPSSASFSCKATASRNGVSSPFRSRHLSPSPSPPLAVLCVYTNQKRAQIARSSCACTRTRVCMCRAYLWRQTKITVCVDLKDVNCHLWKETVLQERARRALFPRCGRGLLNVNYATSLSSNYSLCRSRREKKEKRSRD